MSQIADLLKLAESAGAPLAGIDLATNYATNERVLRASAPYVDPDRYPAVGEFGDRIHVAHRKGGAASIYILGVDGEDEVTLLHELVDYITDPPSVLVETEVPL